MKIPNTHFSTSLSGSATETELRLRSIFQWKKKHPPVVVIALIFILLIGCFGLISVVPNSYKSIPDSAKILDTLEISGSLFYVEDMGHFFRLYQAKEEGKPELLCVLSHWGKPNAKLKKLQLEQHEYLLVEHVSRYPDGIWLRKTFTEVFYVSEGKTPVYTAQFEGSYSYRDFNKDGVKELLSNRYGLPVFYVVAETGQLQGLNDDGEPIVTRLLPKYAKSLLDGKGSFDVQTAQELVRMHEGTVLSLFEELCNVYQQE